MRENRLSGSEGGGVDSIDSSYPYHASHYEALPKSGLESRNAL